MAYCGFVTTLTNVRSHPNADKMKLADCFKNTVCVGLEAAEGDVVIYYPVDGQLSEEYATKNNLVRIKNEDGTYSGGYLDPEKRNIRAIKLRGEKSNGLTMPLSSLEYTGIKMSDLTIGTKIDVVNGHEICQKYIPKTQHRKGTPSAGNKTRKHKVPTAPLFQEHADTEQLAYNFGAFKSGDEIEITLKMHGTSQRTAHVPVLKGYADSWSCQVGNAFRHIMRKMGCYRGEDVHDGKPIYDYGYISGTRRVVLDSFDGGFYGSNEFREQHAKVFEGKLERGEAVYYEVVGFTHTGAPIMASCDNKKLNDKEFIKQYGKETVFSYGCEPNPVVHEGYNDSTYGYQNEHVEYKLPQSDIYVYRMTMTNEDGFVVEYTPDFMRYRCEQMGVKTVPVFAKATLSEDRLHLVEPNGYDHDYLIGDGTIGDLVMKAAERYYDGPDPVGKTHVREGVVVRILNRPKFCAYKLKNFSFKCLEGLVKADATAPDMEESQEVEENA